MATNHSEAECTELNHARLKSSLAAWLSGTVRLPHLPDREAMQSSECWLRNCAGCATTLSVNPARFEGEVLPLLKRAA